MAERRIINGYIVERAPDGTLTTIGPATGGMPADPTFPYEGPKAGADLTGANLTNQGKVIDNEVSAATKDALIRKALAEAARAEAEAKKATQVGPESETQLKAAAAAADLKTMMQTINELQTLYNQNLAGQGVQSLGEYFPSNEIDRIDTLSAGLGQLGMSAFRVPGSGEQSDRELANFINANQPSTWNRDAGFIGKMDNLRRRAENRLAALGQPAPQWVSPASERQPAIQQRDDPMASVAGQPDVTNPLIGSGNGAPLPGGYAPYGAKTRIEKDPAREGLNREVLGMIKGGVSPDLINQHIASRGGVPASPQVLSQAIQYARTNPDWAGVDLETREVPMSGFDQFRNNAPQTMAGTAAATALNTGGMGIPQMLAGGEGLDYLRSQNPGSAFAGDVAGVIGGTSMIGKIGTEATKRIAPSLLTRGGSKGQFGRQLLTDATYGAGYGATTEGDPLKGALTASLGSAGGQVIGKGIQTLGRGVNAPGAAQLYDSGVTPTIGQIGRSRGGIMGNTVAGIEDRIAGIPFIGEAVGNARNRGLQQSNIGDLNNALLPIGGKVNDFGTEGFAAADDAIGQAYTDALDPMRLQIDEGLSSTMDSVPQYRDIIEQNLDNGAMTGRGFQSAKRTIDGEIASATGAPMGYKTLPPLQALRDSMFASAERQAPDLLANYRKADEAYNNLVPIRAATATAENTGGLYTPAQLGRSLRSTDRSVGKRSTARGERPGQDLQTLKQEILPAKVPDSGTVGRAVLAGGVGLPVAGGAALNPLLAGLALPAAAYTKIGQDLVAKALLAERPKLIRQGAGIFGGRKARKGLSGAITAPLLTDY